MSLLNFFKKHRTPQTGVGLETKSFSGYSGSGLHDFLTGCNARGRVTPSAAMELYRSSSSLAEAVDMIATEIEKINPVLQRLDGTLDPDAEVIKLIKKPNGYEGCDEFIGQLARHWLLTHNSLLYAEGSKNFPPSSLWTVKPQATTVMENTSDGYPQSFMVNTGVAQGNYNRETKNRELGWQFLNGNLRQVYNIAGFSSRASNVVADSPLEAITTEINQQISGRDYNLAMMRNGARISLVAVFKQRLSDDQKVIASQALNESAGGPRNAGRITCITAEDLEFKEMSTNNKDMDYLNLDDVARKAIYLRYKIPLPLVDNNASTFNNMEQAVYHLYDMAVLPNVQRLYSGLGKMLLPRYGLDPCEYKITYNTNDIESLRMRKLEELSKMVKDRGITPNEYREALDKEPLEGGDEIWQGANLVPMGQETFTLEDAGVNEDGK